MNTIINKKTIFKFFLKQRFFLLILTFSFFVNLLTWLWIIWQVGRTTEPIPLSFNQYFGIDYLDSYYKIFYWPLSGLLVIAVNFFLAYLVFLPRKFLSNFLILAAFIYQVGILIFYLLLIINYF